MFNRFLGDKWEQVKTLYARLTPSQRLTIAVLGATVAVALLTIALLTGRASYTALARHNDGVELRRMESELRSAGYGVRVHGGTLEVQETQLPGALNFVANRVTGTPRRDGWAWLEEDPKWGETSVRLKEKVLRKKTINLEESIKMSPDIVDAIIELNIKPAGLTVLSGGAEDNSASVLVHLAPGVGRLKSGQVRVIRNVVSGGAPVPFAQVRVTDDRLNEYALEDDGDMAGMAGLEERRIQLASYYEKKIASYLDQTLRGAYSLFVDVRLSRDTKLTNARTITSKELFVARRRDETESGRRDVGGGAPGVEANTSGGTAGGALGRPTAGAPAAGDDPRIVDTEERKQKETEYAADPELVSTMVDRVSTPAGAIEKISVAVRVDNERLAEIAKRVVDPRETTPDKDARDVYIERMRGEIQSMLRIHGEPVVSVLPGAFARGELRERAAEPRTVTAWAREHATLIAMVLFGVAALGFAYTLARRAIPPPIEIPPVELPHEKAAAAEMAAEEDAQEAAAELQIEDKEFAVSVRQIEKLSGERPNLAAGVVKMWIGSDPRAQAEEKVR